MRFGCVCFLFQLAFTSVAMSAITHPINPVLPMVGTSKCPELRIGFTWRSISHAWRYKWLTTTCQPVAKVSADILFTIDKLAAALNCPWPWPVPKAWTHICTHITIKQTRRVGSSVKTKALDYLPFLWLRGTIYALEYTKKVRAIETAFILSKILN